MYFPLHILNSVSPLIGRIQFGLVVTSPYNSENSQIVWDQIAKNILSWRLVETKIFVFLRSILKTIFDPCVSVIWWVGWWCWFSIACILPVPPPRATYDGDSYLISHQNIQQLPNIQIAHQYFITRERDGGWSRPAKTWIPNFSFAIFLQMFYCIKTLT